MTYTIWILLFIGGYILSYLMLRIEHEAENKVYTRGDRLLNFTISLGSWVMILIILIIGWLKKIGQTGYWTKPVKKETK